MTPASGDRTTTISAKIPRSLVSEIDRIAHYRGVSRSFLIRELAEAATDGRVVFNLPPQMTFAELGASEVGRAARREAQAVAAAACREVPATRERHAERARPMR